MVKKVLAFTVAAMFMNFYSPPPVNAEQAAAETYRQLINSGKFYLEYTPGGDFTKRKIITTTVGVAVSGNQKMVYSMNYGVESLKALNSSQSLLNYIPIVGGLLNMFSGSNSPKFHGTYYYDGENYFAINSKKEVIKVTPAQLQDKYINPKDALTKSIVDEFLKLPAEFKIFKNAQGISFLESGTRAIDKKGKIILNYDKYVEITKTAASTSDIWKNFFYVYYDDKGELVGIDKLTVNNDNADELLNTENYPVQRIAVNKFTSTLPEDAFKISDEAKIYDAWLGDMNELVEQRVPAEN